MSAGRTVRAVARRELWLQSAALAMPIALAFAVTGWRAGGFWGLATAGVAGSLLLGFLVWRSAAGAKPRLLAARLDARTPELEDSAELLFQESADLSGLAALQRQRLEARIAAGLAIDPKPTWPWARLTLAWAGSVALGGVALLAPPPTPEPIWEAHTAAPAQAPRLSSVRLWVNPPPYTGLPRRSQSGEVLNAPVGSQLEWVVSFSAPTSDVQLSLANGKNATFRREGRNWRAALLLESSTLYRIEAVGLPQQPWRRIEAMPDAPPVVTVVAPTQRLVIATPGQTDWVPVFEGADDYGLDAEATFRLTLTSGEGEQIEVSRREGQVRGEGNLRRRRWSVPLKLAKEGLKPGGDLIVQLVVRDNRRPQPQIVEGPSVILRWPPPGVLASGLNGLLAPTMPAFFRSQRQIIIDAESLVREQRRLPPEAFRARSTALAADQAALRLRYGQFLGEKTEGAAAPPSVDALPTADAPAAAQPPQPHGSDDHDEEEGGKLSGHSALQEATQAFGHVHDDGDAATLFDPGVRATLARSLDAMWGSERELRQSRPEDALPFAREALKALKKVQEADRIYLAKTGPRLPPIDLSRRLSGKRDGIAPASPLAAFASDGVPMETAYAAWRALEGIPEAPSPDWEALERWAVAEQDRLQDPLGLIAAIEAARGDQACEACRKAVRSALWANLQAQPSTQRRLSPGDEGRRYLEALR